MAKVLLIEDDFTMRSLLQTLLRIEGFEILQPQQIETLDQMMAFVGEEKPDLILLDVNLRPFNGFDLLDRIRQDEKTCSTRVLMSSGIDYTERVERVGANGFLLKPYMPEELIQKMNEILGA